MSIAVYQVQLSNLLFYCLSIFFVFYLFKFEKPGSRDDFDYPDMAEESVKAALKDGGVSYQDIQQAYVGYVYGESVLISHNFIENLFSKCIK